MTCTRASVALRARGKLIGLIVGIGASAALVMLGLTTEYQGPTNIPIPQAGSGSGAVNTTYTQPVVSPINIGGTAKPTTPASAPATPVAVPSIKGKPGGNEE